MTRKMQTVGATPKRVSITDQPKRRIDPTELARLLGANPCEEYSGENRNLIDLAETGTKLLVKSKTSEGQT